MYAGNSVDNLGMFSLLLSSVYTAWMPLLLLTLLVSGLEMHTLSGSDGAGTADPNWDIPYTMWCHAHHRKLRGGDCWLLGTGWTRVSRLWAIFFSCVICFSRFYFVSFSFPYPPCSLPLKKLLICLYLNSWAFALLSFCIFSHHTVGKSGCVVLSCLLGLNLNSSPCMASHCSILYQVNKLVPCCQRLK